MLNLTHFAAFVLYLFSIILKSTWAQCDVNGVTYEEGDQFQLLGQCAQATCQEGGDVTALGCPLIFVDESSGYRLSEEDLSLPWPDCCPRPILYLPCTANGRTYEVDEQVDLPGICLGNICAGNDTYSRVSCGRVGAKEDEVIVPEDTTKPFPECCPHAVPIGDVCIDSGSTYMRGERFQPKNECVEITCLGNNSYSTQNCILLTPPPGYSLSGYNVELVFPYCCPQLLHIVVDDPVTYCRTANKYGNSNNQTFQPAGKCHIEQCQGCNNTIVDECIKYSLLPGYTLDKGNLSLPFPQCCPRPVPVMAPTEIPTTTTYSPLCNKFGKTCSVGEKLHMPDHCGYYLCLGNNHWTETTCVVPDLPEGWILSQENPDEPFPLCCATAVPEEAGEH